MKQYSLKIRYYLPHEEPVAGRGYYALAQQEQTYLVELTDAEQLKLQELLDELKRTAAIVNWSLSPARFSSHADIVEDINSYVERLIS